jgi:hypothetical protein
MVEFEIDGKEFRADKLNAIQQFNVSRKIAPLIPPLIPIFMQVTRDAEKGVAVKDDMDVLAQLLTPFADGLAAMNDEAAEYVFSTCLSVVRYKHGDNWAAIWSAANRVVMFDNLNDGALLIRVIVKVIVDSLGNFIAAFRIGQQETAAAV